MSNEESSSRRVLCLAGRTSSADIQSVATALGLTTTIAQTVDDVLNELNGPYLFLVVALGTNRATGIFDGPGRNESRVLSKSKQAGIPAFVYSRTATQHADTAEICYEAFATHVLCTPGSLFTMMMASLHNDVVYEPLTVFEQKLSTVSNRLRSTPEFYECQTFCNSVKAQIHDLARPLLLSNDDSAPNRVRIVTISDTHGKHSLLHLPPGDILLHTGDVVGNYGPHCDLKRQFSEFVTFLQERSKEFKHVVWIAGNHDTFLDTAEYQYDWVAPMLQTLPDNVHYLENSGIQLLGLKIYGTPWLPSRVETINLHYYSNAFERWAKERSQMFELIPEGLDILLTIYCISYF